MQLTVNLVKRKKSSFTLSLMPNLVTIIFAILVAPSKSLEAPETHDKKRRLKQRLLFKEYSPHSSQLNLRSLICQHL